MTMQIDTALLIGDAFEAGQERDHEYAASHHFTSISATRTTSLTLGRV